MNRSSHDGQTSAVLGAMPMTLRTEERTLKERAEVRGQRIRPRRNAMKDLEALRPDAAAAQTHSAEADSFADNALEAFAEYGRQCMRYEAAVQDLQEAAIWQTAAHFVPNDLKGSAAAQRAVLKDAMAKLQAECPADYEALRARYRTAWNTLDAAAEAMRTSAALGIAVRSCMHLLKAAMPLRSTEGRQMYAALKNAMEAHLAALKRTDALARGIALWPESKAVLEAALRNPRNGFEYFAGRYAAACLAVRPGARAKSVRNARKAAKKAQRRLEAAMSEADDAKAERNAFLEAKGDIYSDEYEAALEVLKNARKAMHLAARMRNEARASLEAARNAEADANAKLEDIRAAIRSSEALGNGVAVCIQMLGRARPLESTEACRTFAGLKAAMTAYMAMLQRADGRPATAL